MLCCADKLEDGILSGVLPLDGDIYGFNYFLIIIFVKINLGAELNL